MVDSLQYLRDRTITSSDPGINHDISGTLNLNEVTLVSNRQSAWDACKRVMLKQRKTSTWTKTMINRQIARYESQGENGDRLPYSGIVLYWLKKYSQKAP